MKFLGKFSNAGCSVAWGGGRQTDGKSFGGGETVGNGRKPVCLCVCVCVCVTRMISSGVNH